MCGVLIFGILFLFFSFFFFFFLSFLCVSLPFPPTLSLGQHIPSLHCLFSCTNREHDDRTVRTCSSTQPFGVVSFAAIVG